MDDELGTRVGDFPLWNGVGLVIGMVIFVMGLIGLSDPDTVCCTGVTTTISLALAIPSLRHIYVAVHEKGLHIRSLFRKHTILWTEIAEVQVDHRIQPQYQSRQDEFGAVIDAAILMAISVVWYVWITLQVFIPIPVSRYTFTLRGGKVVKLRGSLYLIGLEPMIVHYIAPFLPDGTIYTTQHLFRVKRLYRLSGSPRRKK